MQEVNVDVNKIKQKHTANLRTLSFHIVYLLLVNMREMYLGLFPLLNSQVVDVTAAIYYPSLSSAASGECVTFNPNRIRMAKFIP